VKVIDSRDRACFNCKLIVSSEKDGGIWNRARVRCFGSGIVLIRCCSDSVLRDMYVCSVVWDQDPA
jgi:hypothetical protein